MARGVDHSRVAWHSDGLAQEGYNHEAILTTVVRSFRGGFVQDFLCVRCLS